MKTPDSLTLARRLAAKGLVVIPCARPGRDHDGKTPIIKWKKYQDDRPTVDDLARWFRGPMNLAIVCGRLSGVVVLDVDAQDGLRWAAQTLPMTPWRTQTAKGVHLYYRHPGRPVANRVRLPGDTGKLPVDVRGDAGFVLAPGSRHATGVWYRALGDWTHPRAALPVFDPAWLPAALDTRTVTIDEGPRAVSLVNVVDRARKYLAAIPPPEIGYGSDLATFTAACRLTRGFALSPEDAITLLWEWAGNRPGWDRAWIETKVRSALLHGKELMGAML